MANVTASKTVVGNSIAENAGDVVSRKLRIKYTDIVNAGTYSDNDTVTFTIPVNAGEIVETVGVRLVTAFNDSGSGDELDVQIGDGTDDDGFVVAADIHTDQSEISYVANTGAYFNDGTTDNTVNGKLYTSDDTLDVLISPNLATGTDYALSELTAGELVVTVVARDIN